MLLGFSPFVCFAMMPGSMVVTVGFWPDGYVVLDPVAEVVVGRKLAMKVEVVSARRS